MRPCALRATRCPLPCLRDENAPEQFGRRCQTTRRVPFEDALHQLCPRTYTMGTSVSRGEEIALGLVLLEIVHRSLVLRGDEDLNVLAEQSRQFGTRGTVKARGLKWDGPGHCQRKRGRGLAAATARCICKHAQPCGGRSGLSNQCNKSRRPGLHPPRLTPT